MRETIGHGVGDRGVVDVDAVHDDGDLPAGLGEVVEALGDLPALGGAPGAELRRQDRERRTPDGGPGHDEQDPGDDDGPSPSDDERTESLGHHDTAVRSNAAPVERVTGGRDATARTSPLSAVTTSAPDAPKLACWRSASTITWEVMSQPSAHRAGVAAAQTSFCVLLPTSTSAWAMPTPRPVSAPIDGEAGGVRGVVHGACPDRQADREADGRRCDPGLGSAAIPAHSDRLHRPEDGAGCHSADEGGTQVVDVAGNGAGGEPGEWEADEGAHPAGECPGVESCVSHCSCSFWRPW